MKLPGLSFAMFAPEGGGGGGAATPAPSPTGEGGGTSTSGASSTSGGTPSPGSAPPSVSSPGATGGVSPDTSSSTPPLKDVVEAFSDPQGWEDNDDDTATPSVAMQEPVLAPEVPPPLVQEPAALVPTPQTTVPPTGPQAEMPPLSLAEPGRFAESMLANLDTLTEQIAPMYAMSKEEAEAFELNPAGMLPVLAARVHTRVFAQVLRALEQVVPAAFMTQASAIRTNTANAEKFFARWPELDRSAHIEMATRFAKTYRSVHPTATLEQLIEEVGPMVMMAAHVSPRARAAGGVPANGGGLPRAAPPPPFVPAGASVTQVPPPGGGENPWMDARAWLGGDDD